MMKAGAPVIGGRRTAWYPAQTYGILAVSRAGTHVIRG